MALEGLELDLHRLAGPLLDAADLPGVLRVLRELRLEADDLAPMLGSASSGVAQTAARCLGLIGSADQTARLVALLGHADAPVRAAAETALWSLWMRAGDDVSRAVLARSVTALRDGQHDAALRELRSLIAVEPLCAEAHHQLGLVLHAQERYRDAAAAFEQALRVDPYHFPAAAALGHVQVELGEFEQALRSYRRALHIHPHLTEIREIVPRLEAALQRVVA